MIDENMVEQYPVELLPYLYPELYPDYWFPPDSTADPVQGPASEPDPGVVDTPSPEQAPVASDPMEVISVNDLLDIIQSAGQVPAGELPAEELPADENFVDPGDTQAVELDPATLALLDAVRGIKTELIQISDQITEIQLAADSKPLLTTPFEDYSVSEGLLLLLLLSLFLSACYKILRGGLQWLRS